MMFESQSNINGEEKNLLLVLFVQILGAETCESETEL